MNFDIAVNHFVIHKDSVEVTVNFFQEPDVPNDYATVVVFMEKRDWPLSELQAEAIRKAKVFLSHVLSSPPDEGH